MSSKLAKVLLICALAVVLPLFIAGTVIAVYYSMNAVTVFEIYTDNQNISAPTITSGATIEYDAENGSYRVINGHSKNTSVEYSAEGFNFDYWFDGSREEYVKLIGDIESATDEAVKEELTAELDAKKLSDSAVFSFKTGDYENITAVFSVITYDVEYSIVKNPSEGTQETGSKTLTYGQPLAEVFGELANTPTHDFVGFIVNNDESKIYTNATFAVPQEGESIKISALWKEIPFFQVRYYKEEAIVETSDKFNRNTYTSLQIENAMNRNTNGYTAKWLYNGAVFTEVTEDMISNPNYDGVNYINVELSETPINYNIKITGSAQGTTATYRNSTTFTVSDVNTTAFDSAMNASNWTFSQYDWEFNNFVYNGDTYKTSKSLTSAIIAKNPDSAPASVINVNVNFSRVATTYTFNFYDGNEYLGRSTATDMSSMVDLPTDARKKGYQISRAYIGGQTLSYSNYSHTYSNGNVTTSGGSIVLPSSVFTGSTVKSIDLNYTPIQFTATVSSSNYTGTTKIENLTIQNYSSKLAPLFVENNWVKYVNIQTWSRKVSVGSNDFSSESALFNYILGTYRAGQQVTLTSEVTNKITSLTINGITYEDGVKANGEDIVDNPNQFTLTNFNISIMNANGIFAIDLNSTFTDDYGVVKPVSFSYHLNGERRSFALEAMNGDYSIYNFLNIIYSELSGSETTLTIEDITLHFDKVA